MSENSISFIAAGVELQANEQENLAAPSWLTEALLVGQYWQASGLLSDLVTQVQVSRGRMGRYEVCDFVLLMLAYAVSGLPSLAEFGPAGAFAQKPTVMSLTSPKTLYS